jgi:hypothetical protein
MANDNFYGYSNKKPEFILPNGNIDMAFEKINPYEFKRGMDYELTKMGCRNLQSSTPEQREKATTIVLKNLNEMGGYYSGLISYETEYRGRKDKPSFKKYMEGMAEHGMKEINKEFKKDKMENIKLRESINKLVKEVLEEEESPKRKPLPNKNKFTSDTISIKSALEKIIQKAWQESDLEKAKKIVVDFVEGSKINDASKKALIKNTKEAKSKPRLDSYLANALLKFEKMGVRESTKETAQAYANKKNREQGLNEYEVSDRFYSYEDAVEHAKAISKNHGVVQHVNEIPGSLEDSYVVSDWYDKDATLISFENGRQLNENKKSKTNNKMTKKELDKMIMEEIETYLREEEEIEVDVEDDAEGGGSEDVLRKIYDMLKDMFEGEEEEMETDDEDEMEDEIEDEDEDKSEEEEVEESIQLQERFQKLANIIRG